jgi:hypothetical protein
MNSMIVARSCHSDMLLCGSYGFMVTATDSQISGGGGVDKFRIKIWDKENNGGVIYDNQIGDADAADAVHAISLIPRADSITLFTPR